MAGGSSGGNDAAVSGTGGAFGGLTGVSSPLTGIGTAGSPLAMPAATASTPGHMTAAQVAELAAGGAGPENRWLADAISKAGISNDNIRSVWLRPGEYTKGTGGSGYLWETVVTAGGDSNAPTLGTDAGGYMRFIRSVTTGTLHHQRSTSALGVFIAGNLVSKRWYQRARLKLQGTAGINAAAVIAFGTSGSGGHTNYMDIGLIAANSTAKFSARLVGTTTVNLISTVNLDTTAWHEVIVWHDGTNTYLAVDGETPVQGASVVFPNGQGQRPNACYIADSNAGTRELWIDQAMWATERAA